MASGTTPICPNCGLGAHAYMGPLQRDVVYTCSPAPVYCRCDIIHSPGCSQIQAGGQPHRCPVCEGRGSVHAGFYGWGNGGVEGVSPVACRTCGGTGVLWR